MGSGMKRLVFLGILSLFAAAGAEAALSEQIVKYEIQARLDAEAKAVIGREVLTWRNDSDDYVPDLWFHLYMNAFKNERSSFMREAEGRGRRGNRLRDGEWGWIDVRGMRIVGGADLTSAIRFVQPDDGNPDDQTVIKVDLPQPVPPQGTISLEIDFYTKLPRLFSRTGYYRDFFFVAQWFPKIGVYERAGMRYAINGQWNCHQFHENSEFYANFGSYRVELTVPERFVVGATGELVENRANGDGTTSYTYYQEDVHDFAWTAYPRFIRVERDFVADREVSRQELDETARLLGLPAEEVRLKDVKMILLISPEHRSQIERHLRALTAAIKYFGLWYGAYPYKTITLVDPPWGGSAAGGMEYPTLITAGTRWWPSRHAHAPESVIVHEFGHQYWYGLVANNEFEESWLDEGFNTYSTGKILDKVYGPGAFALSFASLPITPIYFGRLPFDWLWGRVKIDQDTDNKLDYLRAPKVDSLARNSWEYRDRDSYVVNSYPRAAITLRTLENLLGEQKMARIMRIYHQRWRFGHPTTDDFIEVVNEAAEQDMTWFFERFFFGSDLLDYAVIEINNRRLGGEPGVYDQNGSKVEVTRSQARRLEREGERLYESEVVVARLGEAVLPVELLVEFEDGHVERRNWDGDYRWAKFKFRRGAEILRATVDPGRKILLDINFNNNSLSKERDRRPALKWWSKVMFWMQQLLALLGGLA